jgi:DNA ligase-associated metallophosphoesterase
MRWVRVHAETSETLTTAASIAPAPITLARSECGALWIELMGARVALRPSGALWIEHEAALVAGDLHLEKGSAYARGGQLLPPYDTLATLDRLQADIDALSPRLLILLGDSFHDPWAPGRLHPEDTRRLTGLAAGRTLLWVEGNHDSRGGASALGALPGDVVEQVRLGPLTLRHEPAQGTQPGEVCGHLHPCVKLVAARRGVRRRAFATDGRRLILPAFGAYAGGLNLCDPAFSGLFETPPLAGALSDGRVHPLPFSALCGD